MVGMLYVVESPLSVNITAVTLNSHYCQHVILVYGWHAALRREVGGISLLSCWLRLRSQVEKTRKWHIECDDDIRLVINYYWRDGALVVVGAFVRR